MKNETKLPVEIIEWSRSKSFASLSPEEKKLVMGYMSEAEYNEILNAQKEFSVYFNEDKNLSPSLKVKESLDSAFRKKHAGPKSVWLQPVALWKVAAGFLLLFFASCLYLKKNVGLEATTAQLVHDTIFVEKRIEAIRHIIDTVVQYKYADAVKKSVQKQSSSLEESEDRFDTAIIWKARKEDIGIRVLQVDDLQKELPNHSGKSMQEDELLKRFNFAKI